MTRKMFPVDMPFPNNQGEANGPGLSSNTMNYGVYNSNMSYNPDAPYANIYNVNMLNNAYSYGNMPDITRIDLAATNTLSMLASTATASPILKNGCSREQ